MLELFEYTFFLRALAAAVLASVTCGIVGTYVVSRRLVFISGGISHASFGGIGIGYFLGIKPIIAAIIFSCFSAMGISYFSKKEKLREDSLIGMMWALGMATGIIFIAITPGYAPNLMSYLFGSILTVTNFDLLLMLGIGIFVILFFSIFIHEIIFTAFDEHYARTRGIAVDLINMLLLIIIALTIVINIRVVGIILVISLLTIPQATAALYSGRFIPQMFLSGLFALLSTTTGLAVSFYLNIPSGAAIICASITIYIICRFMINLLTRNN